MFAEARVPQIVFTINCHSDHFMVTYPIPFSWYLSKMICINTRSIHKTFSFICENPKIYNISTYIINSTIASVLQWHIHLGTKTRSMERRQKALTGGKCRIPKKKITVKNNHPIMGSERRRGRKTKSIVLIQKSLKKM